MPKTGALVLSGDAVHFQANWDHRAVPSMNVDAEQTKASVEHYLATDSATARDRAQLFHLAWDISCSAFAGRQVLDERMVGGNAVRNAMTLFHTANKEPFRQQVHDLLRTAEASPK